MTRRELEFFIRCISIASWQKVAKEEAFPGRKEIRAASETHPDPDLKKMFEALYAHDLHPLSFKDLNAEELDLIYATYADVTMN